GPHPRPYARRRRSSTDGSECRWRKAFTPASTPFRTPTRRASRKPRSPRSLPPRPARVDSGSLAPPAAEALEGLPVGHADEQRDQHQEEAARKRPQSKRNGHQKPKAGNNSGGPLRTKDRSQPSIQGMATIQRISRQQVEDHEQKVAVGQQRER